MEKASHKSQIKYLSVMQNNAFAYSLKIQYLAAAAVIIVEL